ncbi:hypothetical protein TCE0_041f13698 [Talaromyces pinophilus]|uniref:Zn(2)-C6 fungal-type domain-containing protein n=1 Tax=Talaromyces pinophilus TaxID=128442 RepID=A0A6V8HGU6_TALPI|nr:hypothetical protein PENOC_097330 [Penicillium occitanis (nom. inval.)]GAM40952.1 hypothetical protein TCE0_041f13698 [Talaromyces pinophilus]
MERPTEKEDMGTEDTRVSRPSSRDQSSRRIACDICRGRKVRCDRVHPVCGRCRKLGHKCGYTAHRKPDTVKPNISQALITLHERLAQTEAQLALTQRAIPHIGPSSNLAARAMDSQLRLSIDHTESQLPSGMVSPGELNFQYEPFKNFDSQQSLIDRAFDMWNQPNFDFDSIMAPSEGFDYTFDMIDNSSFPSLVPSVSTDYTAGDVELTPEKVNLHVFHQSYFNYVHAVLPMVNRHRFFSELEVSGHRPEMKSLSYSIALLGATVTPEQVEAERNFYHHSRKYLSMAEGDDEAPGFNSLNMLQAVILIAYYEFRRTSFARAWLSLGRANRLAKMLGLHTMDQDDNTKPRLNFVLPLPEPAGLADMEERRRSFWVLFTFDAYASIRTGSKTSIDDEEIYTALPCPGDYSDSNLGLKMPPLSRAVNIPDRTLLSSFAGIILMAYLYRRCYNHFIASQKQDSTGDFNYSFWQYHYQIDKDLSFHSTELLNHLQPINHIGDPLALSLHANLCALQITLHEHAIKKVQNDGLPDLLRVESQNRCTSIAIQVAAYAKIISQLQNSKVSYSQSKASGPMNLLVDLTFLTAIKWISNTFMMWPFSVASQALLRQLNESTSNVGEVATLLHQLWCIMQQLKDESGNWDTLMETIARELSHMGILVASDPPVLHDGLGIEMDRMPGEDMQH